MLEVVALGAENDERMARLREALTLGDGFQLVIVQVEPGEQREEVLRRLSGWSGRGGVPALALVRLARDESPVLRLAGDHAGAILVGLEADGEDRAERTHAMVTELNWSRDRLPERVRGPLVLVVSQRVQTALFEQAPDFYSWRMHSTSIAPPPAQPGGMARLSGLEIGWDPGPEDPAELEAMIAQTLALHPPATRELGLLNARLARARLVRGDNAGAEAALEAARQVDAKYSSAELRIKLLLLRAEVARRRGRMEDLAAMLSEARREAGSSDLDPRATLQLWSLTAQLATDLRDQDALAEVLEAAVDVTRAVEHRLAEALVLLAQATLAAGSAEAVPLLERALELYRQAEHSSGEAAVLVMLARQAAATGRSDDAEAYARDAVLRAEASGSADAVARARAALAQIALDSDRLELAEESLHPAIVATDIGAIAELAEARGKLALYRGDDVDAERHLREALDGYRREVWPWKVAKVSLELGNLGVRTRNWTLALTGLETADRLGDAGQRAMAAHGLAELVLARDGLTLAAADQLVAAAQMLDGAGGTTLSDVARAVRGGVLHDLGRTAEACAEWEAAIAGFEARGQADAAGAVRGLLDRARP